MLLVVLLTQRAMSSPHEAKHWGKRGFRHRVGSRMPAPRSGCRQTPWWTKWCSTMDASGTRNGQLHMRTIAPLRDPKKQPVLQPALRPAVPTPMQRWQTVRQRLQDGGRQFLAGVKRGPRDIPDSSRVRMASVVPGTVSEIRGSRSAGPSQPLVAWDMEPMSLATSNTSDTSVASNSSAGRQRAKRGSGIAAFFSQGATLSKGFSNLSLGRDRDGFAD
mmetsp:Transcript_64023/g.208900  ORF Transcript_64023/g.208900 Transcript_64023/m.208900 type:complete len:218 (+) Transcript_64023:135-788(+)